VHIVDASLPTLKDALNRHLRNVEKKLLDLPPPVSPATAQYTVSRLCKGFIRIIQAKTEPNPEVVRNVFTGVAKELIGTHPIFDVTEDSDKRYSFLTFHEDGGEPGDLEHLQVHQGKSPFRSWSNW
jgi:hypothetical protein